MNPTRPTTIQDLFAELERQLTQGFDRKDGTCAARTGFRYGYQATRGPDGKTHVREFTQPYGENPETREYTLPGTEGAPHVIPDPTPKLPSDTRERNPQARDINDIREPVTDVIDEGGTLTVLAELPGVCREDISLDIDGATATIDVDTALARYHKDLALGCAVDPATAKACCKNGVLQVSIKKDATKDPAKRRVDVGERI